MLLPRSVDLARICIHLHLLTQALKAGKAVVDAPHSACRNSTALFSGNLTLIQRQTVTGKGLLSPPVNCGTSFNFRQALTLIGWTVLHTDVLHLSVLTLYASSSVGSTEQVSISAESEATLFVDGNV